MGEVEKEQVSNKERGRVNVKLILKKELRIDRALKLNERSCNLKET